MFYRAYASVTDTQVERLSLLIHQMRQGRRGPKPKLSSYVLSTIVLAHFRDGKVLTDLAKAYNVGKTQLYEHVTEVVKMLAFRAPSLEDITGLNLAHLILDGTLIRTNRIKNRTPKGSHLYYSGKHKAFGVNLQALLAPDGTPLWFSDGLPGSTHDMSVVRHHGVFEHLSKLDVLTLADLGYQGASRETSGKVVTSYKGKNLTKPYEEARKAHAVLRCLGERGFALLKNWKVMRHFTRDPALVGAYARAILVLEEWK